LWTQFMQLHIHVFCLASLVFQRNLVNISRRRTIYYLLFSRFFCFFYFKIFVIILRCKQKNSNNKNVR